MYKIIFLLKKVFVGFFIQFKAYIFLFFLFLMVAFRLIDYKFPPPVDKNYSKIRLITSNYTLDNSKFVIKSNNLRLVFYQMPKNDFGSYKDLTPGDLVFVSGRRYYNTVYVSKIDYISTSYFSYIYLLRDSLMRYSDLILNQPSSSLLKGMLFGTDPVLTSKFNNNLIKVGLIHIIVVSGFNVSLVIGLSYRLFSFISIKKRFLLGSFFVILYLILVGFEPPVVRAVLMGLLVAYAQSKGETYNSLYVLFIVLSFMLLIQPTLIVSLSLQLTFLATLGIYLLGIPLSLKISNNRRLNFIPDFIKNDIPATFSAQLFVTPLLINKFGSISLISLPANFLILWVIPLIMFLGILYLILSYLYLFPLVTYFNFILQAPITLFIDFVNFMASLPYSFVSVSLSFNEMLFIYLTLFLFVFTLNKIFFYK